MRFIVNKKLYDTDNAELICTGLKNGILTPLYMLGCLRACIELQKALFYRRSEKYVSAAREEYR